MSIFNPFYQTALAAYPAKLEGYISEIRGEANGLEDLREQVSFFVLEHYQHELDMAAIRLRRQGSERALREL
jgi:hypothetical protein